MVDVYQCVKYSSIYRSQSIHDAKEAKQSPKWHCWRWAAVTGDLAALEALIVTTQTSNMQFQPRGQVLTGPELLELVAISPDELAMKAV